MKTHEAMHKLHLAEKEVSENTIDLFPVTRRIQKWAAQNAYTLVFLVIMFIITWILFILVDFGVI